MTITADMDFAIAERKRDVRKPVFEGQLVFLFGRSCFHALSADIPDQGPFFDALGSPINLVYRGIRVEPSGQDHGWELIFRG